MLRIAFGLWLVMVSLEAVELRDGEKILFRDNQGLHKVEEIKNGVIKLPYEDVMVKVSGIDSDLVKKTIEVYCLQVLGKNTVVSFETFGWEVKPSKSTKAPKLLATSEVWKNIKGWE